MIKEYEPGLLVQETQTENGRDEYGYISLDLFNPNIVADLVSRYGLSQDSLG